MFFVYVIRHHEGYHAIGQHVCQNYNVTGKVFIDNAFFGGRCVRLCHDGANSVCSGKQVPVRYNSTDATGVCFETICYQNRTALLLSTARANYHVWENSRSKTGMYADNMNLETGGNGNVRDVTRSATGVTGLGIIVECAAHGILLSLFL